MKKLSFFLMAMLVSLTSFAAALGEGYEKVTKISTLTAGDKVVIYADAISLGVTGWNGSKDATVAESGWVEYLVETGTGGVYLKDEGKNKYITSPGGNAFKYGTKTICTVDANGVLKCSDRFLCQNGTYYRMYTAIGSYKPFYVYKVVETAAPGEATISVNAGSVDFGAVKVTELESVEAKTLTVTGTELTEGITVSLSDQNFTTDVTELPKEGGDIKIAPATNLVPNTYETTLTLTSGTTTQTVTLSINVKDVYTITWDALGTITTTTIVQGDKLVLPEEPTCDYKTFVGWATDAEVSADGSDIIFVNDFTIPTTSTTYYAVFAVMSDDATAEKTGTYTMANYAAGTQYAKNEEHKLDDDVTIYTSVCHFTSELRIYSSSTNNGYVISNELPGAIKSMSFNAGNKADNLVVYGSTDGSEWFEVGKIATKESYADYTLSFGETNYTYFKLDVEGTNQIRIKKFSITYLAPIYTDYSTTCEAEIEWMEMPLEITNLTTEVMEVEGAKYLRLQGRNDMDDADVMLFLNNYADVDDDYEVNAESSYMTYGGMELTVLEGVMTQTSETDKGTIYEGTVRTYVAEDSLYVAFNLTMYAAPATVLVLTDAVVAINEDLGTLTFNVATDEGGYYAELAGYTAPGVHEGPQICLFETPEVVAYTNYAETSVADGVITLKGEFTSFTGVKFDLTISGKLPVAEPTTITYELNGGVLPAPAVPTNAELWGTDTADVNGLMHYFNHYYNLKRSAQDISAAVSTNPVATFLTGMPDDAGIFVDEESKYKWLGDYIVKVTNDQIAEGKLSVLTDVNTNIKWRYGVQAFFMCLPATDSNYKGWADFTEAGKPENWGPAYQAANALVLPTEPVAEDYTLPTPTKEGYTFVGWYDNAAGEGEAYKVIPAGWVGTLYAIWKQDTTTALDNIAVEGKAVKAIINGQVLIMIGDKTFNIMGQQVK